MEDLPRKEALYRLGRATFEDRIIIAWALSPDAVNAQDWQRLYRFADFWTPPAFPVKGQDLLARGVAPGPRVGALLRELEASWIASNFTISREDLLRDLTDRS